MNDLLGLGLRALSARALDKDRPDRMDEVLEELRKVTAVLPAMAVT